MITRDDEISSETIDYINKTNIEHRKSMGQFFTPKKIRDTLIECLPNKAEASILEPSCGSGEFIDSIQKKFTRPKIDAFEIDKNLFDIVKSKYPSTNIRNEDTLTANFDGKKYDFVIGNPPYFEFSPTKNIKETYKDVIHGRCNIYNLFIKLGLDLLNDGGYLAYVVPTSMNNGCYFSKLREYIIDNARIEKIILLDSDLFVDALQSVMILIIRKLPNDGKYIFKKNNIVIFSSEYEYLNSLFKDKKSLKELGFSVKTGSLVWNQHKNHLTDDRFYTRIIWSHNISSDGSLDFDHQLSDAKKPFVRASGKSHLSVVVNRITGSGQNARIRAAVVNLEEPWIAENHVNVITHPNASYDSMREIQRQLVLPETIRIIRLITGNTQLSKNELENLIPLDCTLVSWVSGFPT